MKRITLFSLVLCLFCLTTIGDQTEYILKCEPIGAKRTILLQQIHGTMYNVRVSWSDELKKETRNGRLVILTSRDLFNWNVQKEFRFGPSYPDNLISRCSYVSYGLFVEDDPSMPKTVCFYYNAKVVFD